MAVPRIIEFIESLQKPEGGFVSEHGGIQVVVPFFPPNLTSAYTITPLEGTYALISYRVSFGQAMVPNTCSGWFEHAGRHRYIGTITSTVIHDGLEWYVVVTDAEPFRISVTNMTGLNQYFEETNQFAVVASVEDYDIILKALKDLANEGSGSLQREALELLRVLVGVAPAPPPAPPG